MLSTSFAFRRYVAGGGHLANKVDLSFADGTTRTLHGEDLAMGGVSFSSASSSLGSFDIGAAIIGTASLSLANHDERWNDFDFTGATCVVSLGAVLGDDTVEWIRKGTYGVAQPELYDSTIELDCMDNMRLFQVPYSDVRTAYPATLRTIVSDVCLSCGVMMLSASFPHDSQVVPTRPNDDNLSCLDVLSWAAQMAGCFCDVDTWGRLRVRWYDTSAYETEDWLDGGSYLTETTPYSDGDDADGGGFHTDADDADGGDFSQTPWAVVSAIKSLSTATDDVVITGVRVTASDEVKADGTGGEKGESYLYGSEGYVISIEGNALVAYGCAQSVATTIGPSIVGMRFRPLTVTAIGDPAIEAGDPMLVIDWRQRTFRSWVTSNTWKQGSYQSLACSAETPARKSADSHSAITRAIVQQRNTLRAEMTVREQAIANLANQIESSGGLYKTEHEQPDHSVIYYLHDKPTLAESTIIWKLTSQAFAISTDGGATYPFGFDAWGTAILNAIYAIGIDADYINTGILRVGSASDPVFLADFDTESVRVSGDLLIRASCNIFNGSTNFYNRRAEANIGIMTFTDSDLFSALTGSVSSSSNFNLPGLRITGINEYNGDTVGFIQVIPPIQGTYKHASIYSDCGISMYGTEANAARAVGLELNPSYTRLRGRSGSTRFQVTLSDTSTEEAIEIYAHTINIGNPVADYIVNVNQETSFTQKVTMSRSLTVSGTKSRVVSTENYSDRLLYCYETPAPLFGDVGSGTVGEDGMCVVAIDDVFAECARTDMAYQVFLQKCGPGDLWVIEKTPGWFVVEGTPGLAFDWEVKGHQTGYETERLDDVARRNESDSMGIEDTLLEYEYGNRAPDDLGYLYDEELACIEQIESLYEEAAA